MISDFKLRERVSHYDRIQRPVLNAGGKVNNPYLSKIQLGRAITRFSFISEIVKKSLVCVTADSVGLDQRSKKFLCSRYNLKCEVIRIVQKEIVLNKGDSLVPDSEPPADILYPIMMSISSP